MDYSTHLNFANQSYYEHFKDSMYFSFRSLKATFYFFVHAMIPDVYVDCGSYEINELDHEIKVKQLKYKIFNGDLFDLEEVTTLNS